MWSLSPHATISFPLSAPPSSSLYLLPSCFNPSVSFSYFFPPLSSTYFSSFFSLPVLYFSLLVLSFPFLPCAVCEITHFVFSSVIFIRVLALISSPVLSFFLFLHLCFMSFSFYPYHPPVFPFPALFCRLSWHFLLFSLKFQNKTQRNI